MPRLAALLLAMIMTLALAACDEDDPDMLASTASFSGTLVLVDDGSPLEDLVVTLFDPASQTAVARDVSDSNGAFVFEPLEPGTYLPVVHANGFKPLFLPQARWKVEAGDAVQVELRMRRAGAISPSNYHLAGTIVDQATHEPIANARVEMNFVGGGEVTQVNWSEFVGWSTTLEDTTDEAGSFWIAPVTIILSPQAERAYPETRVTAPGYKSKALRGTNDPETANVSFYTIGLTPGRDEGIISGKVVDLKGAPVAGVQVSAEWRQYFRSDFERGFTEVLPDEEFTDQILVPDGSGFTDATGDFRITGLPQGNYNVRPGADTDDGWVGFMVRGIEIETANGNANTRLVCVPSIVHTTPDDGVMVETVPERLAWEAVPDAISYVVTITRGSDGHVSYPTTEEPFYELSPGSPLYEHGGAFAWSVLAYGDAGVELSISDRPWVFHLPTD